MGDKSKHLLTASITLTALLVGMALLGVFSKNKIIITTLATTGPDYEVVYGRLKLMTQMPDSVDTDESGIMVSDDKSEVGLGNYLHKNYRAFGDYFILTEQVVGIRQSDSYPFHPLIEIYDWQHIDAITFWFMEISALVCLVMLVRSTKKYLKLIKQPQNAEHKQ